MHTEQLRSAHLEARDHDARRHLLVNALAKESIHKKFDAGRGREPVRQTVDRKLIMDIQRRMLLQSLGNPSVPYSPLSSEELDGGEASSLALATDRDVILPKRRKTGVSEWRYVPVDHFTATAAPNALMLKNLPDDVRARTLDSVRNGTGKVELRTRVKSNETELVLVPMDGSEALWLARTRVSEIRSMRARRRAASI